MKVLSISGGATKISGLYGKVETLVREFGYKPDIITGVSSGAILSVPVALGMWDKLKPIVLDFTTDDIFDIPPFKGESFSFKGLLRVLLGKPSFGRQLKLRETLKNVVTEKDFVRFKMGVALKEIPEVFIGVTNFNTGQFIPIRVSTLSYKEYLDYTLASASIPLAVEAVKINGNYYYDGGVLHHTCASRIIDYYKERITHCITVYSRPEVPDKSYPNFNQIDASQVFKALTDLQTIQISLSDQHVEKLLCEKYNIRLKQAFCPKVLTSLYDTDPKRLRELYNLSREENIEDYLDFI